MLRPWASVEPGLRTRFEAGRGAPCELGAEIRFNSRPRASPAWEVAIWREAGATALLPSGLGVLSDTRPGAPSEAGLRIGVRSGTRAKPGLRGRSKMGTTSVSGFGPEVVPEPKPGALVELRLGVMFGSSMRTRLALGLRAMPV